MLQGWIVIALLSFVGGLIGWVTNILAIKLIFRPLQPIKIPYIPIVIQGLIPKRREEIAKSIGSTIEEELVSIDELIDRVITEDNKREMLFTIKLKISRVVDEKLPPIIPTSIRKGITGYIGDIIDKEGANFISDLSNKLVIKAKNSIKIGAIVEEKINNLDLENLERIILSIAQKELKHIEWLGAILGFIIGFFQALIIMLVT